MTRAVSTSHAVSVDQSRTSAFDDLISPHLEAGYKTALAILRDHEEAHDAMQEAAVRAWRKLGQLKDGRNARPWFLAIVANQCRSMRRTRWWSVQRVRDLEPERPTVEPNPDLGRALSKLPPEDRLPLFLHFYLDLSLAEVGTVLGLSPAGAKTRVYRAAKKLRPDLELKL
jgi:RNA polymerase sigma-70 factor, ECF subfamily